MVETLEKPKQKKKQPHKIGMSDFKPSEYAYMRYAITIPVEWDVQEVLKPEFWSNVSHLLEKNDTTRRPAQIGTIIEVRNDDHSLYGELYVTAVSKSSMQVEWVRKPVRFGDQEIPTSETHKIRWNLGPKKHEVIRLSDNEVVGAFDTKKEANDLLRDLK